MKVYKEFPRFPVLRRKYSSYSALGAVINRSASYVNNCLNGRRSFTQREKDMILRDLGLCPEDAESVFYIPEVA